LLTDSSVLGQDSDASDWWKLTPDESGNYINGTWTKLTALLCVGSEQRTIHIPLILPLFCRAFYPAI